MNFILYFSNSDNYRSLSALTWVGDGLGHLYIDVHQFSEGLRSVPNTGAYKGGMTDHDACWSFLSTQQFTSLWSV